MRVRFMVLAALVVALLVAGCGTSPATQTPPPISKPSPTATPRPTPIATVSADAFAAACPRASKEWTFPTIYRLGDVLLQGGYVGIASRKLADATPRQPLPFPDPNDQALVDKTFPIYPVTNPMEGGGILLALCNSSATQAHVISGLAVRIAQFTPYTGRVQSWSSCAGYYSRSAGNAEGYGCGFGFVTDEALHVTFAASAGTGAEASATQVDTDGPSESGRSTRFGPLPVTLAPGHSMWIVVTASLPVATGTYSFQSVPIVDGARLPATALGDPALFAPDAVKWTGKACLSDEMQRLMPPATGSAAYYICPE